MKIALRFSAILFFAALLSLAFTPAIGKWVTYSSEEGKYSLKFPEEPQESVEELEDVKIVKAEYAGDGILFFGSYTLHQNKLVDHKGLAKISIDSFVEKVNGKVSNETPWQVKGHEGLKATVMVGTPETGPLQMEYRVILIDQLQYQLVIGAAPDKWPEKQAKRFFDSFKLKD